MSLFIIFVMVSQVVMQESSDTTEAIESMMTITNDSNCDVNDMCLNDTMSITTEMSITNFSLANTNTTMINTTVSPTIKPILRKNFLETGSNKYKCTCNLHLQMCDINCCCDSDCTYENKLTFDHCEEEPDFYYDTRYCNYLKYAYKNYTPYEWTVHQNGLFCIIKSNLPPYYIHQRKKTIKSIDDANLEKISKTSSWPNVYEKETTNASNTMDFVYGHPIWLSKNNSTFDIFGLPSSFVTNICLIKKDVKYLQNIKTKCGQTQIDTNNPMLNAETFFKNISIISSPGVNTSEKYCKKDNCISLTANLCDDNFESCSNYTGNKAKMNCTYKFPTNQYSCVFMTKKIKYNFYHNGTRGLTKVDIFIALQNLTQDLAKGDFVFIQEYEVNFFWTNYTLNYSSLLSGNPGYKVGKNILVGNLHKLYTVKNQTNSNTTQNITHHEIKRNFVDIQDNFLIFPDSKKGRCFLNNKTYIPVEFGYNMIIKCGLQEELSTKNLTAHKVCVEVQDRIFKYFGMHSNKTVGIFGNANSNNPSEWLPIIFNKTVDQIRSEINGSVTKNVRVCRNIVSGLKIDIFYSRVDLENVLNQNKIIATTATFTNKSVLQFEANKFDVDLRIEIMFYDVTERKIKEFVDPPTLKIRLPYDFFYPFVKIDSGCGYLSECVFLILLVLVCDLFVI